MRFNARAASAVGLVAVVLGVAACGGSSGAVGNGSGDKAATRESARGGAGVEWFVRAGPRVRAGLLRLTEDEHWLLLTLHHIVADDRSLAVFWRELSTFYDARRPG